MKMRLIFILLMSLFVISCNNKKEIHMAENEFYTCSMDPQVMEKKPGRCPICKMELTKITVDINEKNKPTLKLSKQQIELGNIKTMEIHKGSFDNSYILNGKLVLNQNLTNQISAKIGGRVDKLFIKATGETISEGQALYVVYSPELLQAKNDYLIAIENKSASIKSDIDYDALAKAAKTKLLLWGLTEEQIAQLKKSADETFTILSPFSGIVTEMQIREGDYVNDGAPILSVNSMKQLWAEAQVYSNEMNLVKKGTKVSVSIDGQDEALQTLVDFTYPEFNLQAQYMLARTEVENPKGLLKVGTQANIVLPMGKSEGLTLPVNAVIQSSSGAIIWVKNQDGTFQNRMVSVGKSNGDLIEITDGLSEGESVVISGAYLLQSEFVFKKGNNVMAGHDMSNMKM